MQTANSADLLDKVNKLLEQNKYRIGKYGTINGYISVTRLIKEMADDSAIRAWRERVGEREADKILNAALKRGRRMHELIENYFAGNEIALDLTQPGDAHYNKISAELENIEPLLFETCLFSDNLQITGKTDTIGTYKGVLSTIDYKTSRRSKNMAFMTSYGVQVALYSMLFLDMTGHSIRQGVLINAPDDEDGIDAITPHQVFVFDVADYVPLAIDLITRYRKGERKCVKL